MQCTIDSSTIAFWIALLLIIARPSHQYTYACNPNATCGCSSNLVAVNRIVGGESAETSAWGWVVSISVSSNTLCGGAILSSSWVITAAHCVSEVSASEVTVYAGANVPYSGQSRGASKLIVHADYAPKTRVNDIALIQLRSPLPMTNSIRNICVPSVDASTLSAGEWPPAGSSVVAAGWGELSEGGSLPPVLQQVTLQTIDYRASTCKYLLNDLQRQLCAGVSGGGKDTCQGDSGSPLMMFTASQQWELVGLTSYGAGCARPDQSGVYTRVAYYQSWIAQKTGNAYATTNSSREPSSNNSSGTKQAPLLLYLSAFLFIFFLSIVL